MLIHLSETEVENDDSQKNHRMSPTEYLESLGFLKPGTLGAHGVWLSDADLGILRKHGVSLSHNPESNMKLASGTARVPALRRAGVPVGLGTDGAASNNRLDVMGEMRTAALLAKGTSGNAAAVSAADTLEMATLEGARALGLDAGIGSIERGKWADLAAVELSSLETLPCFDPVSHLVYAAGREHVTHAWVAGEARLDGRRLVTLDEQDLRDKAHWWRTRLS